MTRRQESHRSPGKRAYVKKKRGHVLSVADVPERDRSVSGAAGGWGGQQTAEGKKKEQTANSSKFG